MSKIFIGFIFIFSCVKGFGQELVFKGGHSHNDYLQPHPLTDALNNGLVSIEADVFLKDGVLLVGHEEKELSNGKTLENMYIKPLFEHFNSSNTYQPVILMIDIKEEGEDCYTALKTILNRYQSSLTHYQNGKINKKDITIILSGDRPVNMVKRENNRYAFIDGRIEDIEKNESSNLFPLISDDWNKIFTWRGDREMSKKELEKLKQIINECHSQGKMIRFWGYNGTGEKAKTFWSLLMRCGVDLIGTDNPKEFREFINNWK